MFEFEFWNKRENHYEILFGYSYKDATKKCDHLDDLTWISTTYID